MKLFGIIGDPISHSLSPLMQNKALQKMELDYLYLPFHVKSRELKGFLSSIKKWKMTGINVTIPHKEAVLKYLDWISPEAKAIGAVNTILRKGNRLLGYNTDAPGYLESLKQEGRFDPGGKIVLLLGAGGAARAVLFALAKAGAKKIIVCNRTPQRATRLIRDFQRQWPRTEMSVIPMKEKNLRALLPSIHLLINSTSLGLHAERFSFLPLKFLNKKALVSDLVYRPLLTPLLKQAKRLGLRTHSGEGMLVHQGAEAFRLWTGQEPDVRFMHKTVLKAL